MQAKHGIGHQMMQTESRGDTPHDTGTGTDGGREHTRAGSQSLKVPTAEELLEKVGGTRSMVHVSSEDGMKLRTVLAAKVTNRLAALVLVMRCKYVFVLICRLLPRKRKSNQSCSTIPKLSTSRKDAHFGSVKLHHYSVTRTMAATMMTPTKKKPRRSDWKRSRRKEKDWPRK